MIFKIYNISNDWLEVLLEMFRYNKLQKSKYVSSSVALKQNNFMPGS